MCFRQSLGTQIGSLYGPLRGSEAGRRAVQWAQILGASPSRSDWDRLPLPAGVGVFLFTLTLRLLLAGVLGVGLSTLGWSLCVLMPGFGSSRGQALDGTGHQATGQLGIPPVPRAFAVSIFGPCHFLTVATAQ